MTKRNLLFLSFALAYFISTLNPIRQASAHAGEEIQSFDSLIQIQSDGSLLITETIDYDFDDLERHGIFREIQMEFANQEGTKFETPISVLSVTDQFSNPYKYSTSKSNGLYSIKIGDANKYVSGIRTYKITYEIQSAVEGFSDHDEVYFNVTGNDWQVPIEKVTATILYPEGANPQNMKVACFTGSFGSTSTNCTSQLTETSANYTSLGILLPGDGISVLLSFDKGLIQITPKKQVADYSGILLILGIIWYVVIPLLVAVVYFKIGRDPKINTAIPALFEPPSDSDRRISPAEA